MLVCLFALYYKSCLQRVFTSADPEYLAFVEQLGKPTEYLPSAEVQLERKEAEKAAALGLLVELFWIA